MTTPPVRRSAAPRRWVGTQPRGRRSRPGAAVSVSLLTLASVVVLAAPAARAGSPKWQCSLTEPFASVAIGQDALLWVGPSGATRARVLGRQESGGGGAATTTIRVQVPSGGIVPAEAATLALKPTPGSDGMSDRTWDRSLEVGSPARQTGGCEEIPGNHALHRVVNVSAGDSLNVRSRASTAGRVLTTVPPGGFVWVSGSARRSGAWVSVAVVTWPGGESGPATLLTGWVNSRFLAAQAV